MEYDVSEISQEEIDHVATDFLSGMSIERVTTRANLLRHADLSEGDVSNMLRYSLEKALNK